MTRTFSLFVLALAAGLLSAASAQVPQLSNYQGRVAVGTVNFDGSGLFKFALVNANGSQTYWSNDGSSVAGSDRKAAPQGSRATCGSLRKLGADSRQGAVVGLERLLRASLAIGSTQRRGSEKATAASP